MNHTENATNAQEEVVIARNNGAIATFPVQPAETPVVQMWNTRYGVLQASEAEDIVTHSLVHYGEWAEQELDIIGALLDEGSVALQYGAEYGTQTLCLSSLVGDTGQVHAVEPRRLCHIKLCAAVALNKVRNVYPHHGALGERQGQIDLPASGSNPQERAHQMTLDMMELESLHLLKVNLTGSLATVLAGAGDTLHKHKPAIYFRLSTMDFAVSDIAALKALGYRCWSHLPYMYNPANAAGNKLDLFPGFALQNVIAVHKDASVTFEHLREL